MNKKNLLDLARPHYTEIDILELEHAIDFATKKHHGQKRKSGEPYIIHPLSVAAILVDWRMDIDSVLTGVLHDTVEDTDATLEEIETYFGRDIAFLVDGVTKVSKARSGMRDIDSYLPQTKDNLTKLLIAVGQDVRVLIIKLADRTHNMRTLKFMTSDKQKKIAKETIEVFAPLADRLNMGRVRVELEELSFKYLNPRQYERTKALIQSRIKKSQRKLAGVRREVDNFLKAEKINHQIDGRIKSAYSLYKKLDRVGNIDDIYDLIALRIIVDDTDSCYLVMGELHRHYEPMVDRIKDYIAHPKQNGYQSLHTTIVTKNGQIVEFQIRTHKMHEYAERGLAASFHYNEQKLTENYRQGTIAELPEHLHWIKDLQTAAASISKGSANNSEQLNTGLFIDRIFVYSPKGDIYDLRKGAMPLDYAYKVHSDVAAHASGFKVNGVMKPFSYVLQSGDTIEVLTNKYAKPKQDWLGYTTTSYAQEKLRAQLRATPTVFIKHLSKASKIIKSNPIKRRKK